MTKRPTPAPPLKSYWGLVERAEDGSAMGVERDDVGVRRERMVVIVRRGDVDFIFRSFVLWIAVGYGLEFRRCLLYLY